MVNKTGNGQSGKTSISVLTATITTATTKRTKRTTSAVFGEMAVATIGIPVQNLETDRSGRL